MAENTDARPSSGADPDSPLSPTGNAPETTPAAPEPAPQVRLDVDAVAKLNMADFQNAVLAPRELAVAQRFHTCRAMRYPKPSKRSSQ
jgi:hypothetical protein